MRVRRPSLRSSFTAIALACAILNGLAVQQVAAISAAGLSSALTRSELYQPNGCSSTTVGTGGPSGNNIFLLGDSILDGAYNTSGDLKTDLTTSGWTPQVDASDGRALKGSGGTGPGTQQPGLQAIQTDSADIAKADVVVVELGTNNSGSASDFQNQIDSAIQEIKAVPNTQSDLKIYWVNLFSKGSVSSYADAYNNAIQSQSNPDGYSVIDTTNATITLSPDNIHPDTAGYTTLSQVISTAIGQAGSGGGAGSCCPGGGSTTLTGSTPSAQIWNYFIGQGLSNVSVAAIMGNMYAESGFDPDELNGGGDTPDPSSVGIAWGLVQWNPGSKVIGIQHQSGVSGDIAALSTQVNVIWSEASTNNSPSGGWDFNTFKSNTNVGSATTYWLVHFEGLTASDPSAPTRINAAQAWLSDPTGEAQKEPGKPGVSGGSPTPTPGSGPSDSCGAGASGTGAYQNPLRDVQQLSPERIDQGVDYSGEGPVHPLGDGTIVDNGNGGLTSSGWDYGGYDAFIIEKLSDGPASGKLVYVAEACIPKVTVGQTVTPNDVLCNMINPSSTGIETGWASGVGATSESSTPAGGSINGASACIVASPSWPTLIGENYSDLLVSLGAPSGVHETKTTCGTMPPGYPSWGGS